MFCNPTEHCTALEAKAKPLWIAARAGLLEYCPGVLSASGISASLSRGRQRLEEGRLAAAAQRAELCAAVARRRPVRRKVTVNFGAGQLVGNQPQAAGQASALSTRPAAPAAPEAEPARLCGSGAGLEPAGVLARSGAVKGEVRSGSELPRSRLVLGLIHLRQPP